MRREPSVGKGLSSNARTRLNQQNFRLRWRAGPKESKHWLDRAPRVEERGEKQLGEGIWDRSYEALQRKHLHSRRCKNFL